MVRPQSRGDPWPQKRLGPDPIEGTRGGEATGEDSNASDLRGSDAVGSGAGPLVEETRLSRRGALAAIGTVAIGIAGISTASAEFAGGSGTESNPYQIANWEHLDSIRSEDPSAHYVLNNDLDADAAGYETFASADANDGDGWDPIDDFDGAFEGDGHTISDLSIDRPGQGNDFIGLFGEVTGAFTDLHVSGDVVGRSAGMLAGKFDGTMSDCSASGSVSGKSELQAQSTGGLVGENRGVITDCYADVIVQGDITVGGFVGLNNGKIADSYATGQVSGFQSFIGGFVGENDGFGEAAEITTSYATGEVFSDPDDSVLGDVTGVGGFVGRNDGRDTDAIIEDCYARGNVNYLGINPDGGIGGLIGENVSDGEVRRAYAAGDVDASSGTTGGIAGRNEGKTLRVYYDADVNDEAWGYNGGRGIARGLSAHQMQGVSPVEWMPVLDFANTWALVVDGDDYPVLRSTAGLDEATSDLDPIGPFENGPLDLNGDGLYEDVNGDGRVSIADVQALQYHVDDQIVQNNTERFNFSDGDPDEVTDADVAALYEWIEGVYGG